MKNLTNYQIQLINLTKVLLNKKSFLSELTNIEFLSRSSENKLYSSILTPIYIRTQGRSSGKSMRFLRYEVSSEINAMDLDSNLYSGEDTLNPDCSVLFEEAVLNPSIMKKHTDELEFT